MNHKDLLDLSFYEKSPFSGSLGSMCYRIVKCEVDGEAQLEVSVWLGPYAYPMTDPAQMKKKRFPFHPDGLEEIAQWLTIESQQYPEQMPSILDVEPYQADSELSDH